MDVAQFMNHWLKQIWSLNVFSWTCVVLTDLVAAVVPKETSDGFGVKKKNRHVTPQTLWVHCLAVARAADKFPLGSELHCLCVKLPIYLAFQSVPHFTGVTRSTLGAASTLDQLPILIEIPAFGSVPRFHTGHCWWFSLQFPIGLESFPRFFIGDY